MTLLKIRFVIMSNPDLRFSKKIQNFIFAKKKNLTPRNFSPYGKYRTFHLQTKLLEDFSVNNLYPSAHGKRIPSHIIYDFVGGSYRASEPLVKRLGFRLGF